MEQIRHVDSWPYTEVSRELQDFRQRYSDPVTGPRDPKRLWVGSDLWDMLREAFNDNTNSYTFAAAEIPIQLDHLKILEPHEFIFSST